MCFENSIINKNEERVIQNGIYWFSNYICSRSNYCSIWNLLWEKEKKVGELLAPKVELLIEMSSKRILEKQRELNRVLTDNEKNKIVDECYNRIWINERADVKNLSFFWFMTIFLLNFVIKYISIVGVDTYG